MGQNNYQGALQQPIGSGFNATSTASEVIKGIDLTGKTAIVTGGNTGIGLETTKTLAAAGTTVVVPARDVKKAETNLRGISRVEIEAMDLMDPKSIDFFAERFLASGRPLHLLINNAGIMWVPLRRDSRGIESQLATKLNVKPMALASTKIYHFQDHPLLQSCLASLIPYFEIKDLPEDIASLKITEAISILRANAPDIDHVLANFEEPGKIDLASYMERNFMFNLPLEKFGYLTGRSLTTFKRDFSKVFDPTPQRWLTQKRLELAHYQLMEKKKKPVDICYEVGFENLSHFSYAFKKHFGYPPTDLTTQQGA
jgi:AraC-like DNA-binding protein